MNFKRISGNKSRRVSDGIDYSGRLSADQYKGMVGMDISEVRNALGRWWILESQHHNVVTFERAGFGRLTFYIDNNNMVKRVEGKVRGEFFISDSRRVSDERRIKDDTIEDYIKTLVAEIITTEDYGISERFPMKDNYPEGSVRKLESFIASVKNYSEATNTTPVIIPQTDYYRIVFGDANNDTVGEIFYMIKQLPTDKLTNDMENLISIS